MMKRRLLLIILKLTGLWMPSDGHWSEACPSCKGYPEYPVCTCSRRVRFRRFARRHL